MIDLGEVYELPNGKLYLRVQLMGPCFVQEGQEPVAPQYGYIVLNPAVVPNLEEPLEYVCSDD